MEPIENTMKTVNFPEMKLIFTHVVDDRAYHIWRLPDGHLITLYGHKDAWARSDEKLKEKTT